ncbi:MAG: hypothetical protein KBA40_01375 [Candidatus Peribacteraceae bacterium]|nr:hypothetical protein [Candidatus Peribacteraceae bacterium]MBP9850616.1 hypothetical protein [Candidatus Peribacteraceae bacterium]
MRIILGLLGIAFAAALIKYREQVGGMLGEPAWADKIGGIYNLVIIIGVIFFFWSIAYMTNTQDIFFAPLLNFLPHSEPAAGGFPGAEF